MKGYPKGFLFALIANTLVLLLTGFLLAPMSLEFRFDVETPWRPTGDLRLFLSSAHSLSSYLMLGFLGALWSRHMRSGWRRRKNKGSGGSLFALFILLGLSGVGIYYLGGEFSSRFNAQAHVILGFLLPFFWVLHQTRGVRSRRRAEQGDDGSSSF